MTRNTKIAIGLSLVVVLGALAIIIYRKNKPKPKSIKQILEPKKDIDKSKKGYRILSKELKKVEDFLSIYEKDGLILKESESNLKTSEDATKSAYFMLVKDFQSIKYGIENDSSLNNEEKSELLSMYDDFFNSYLPTYFDKNQYNTSNQWYKDMVSKIKLSNLYI
jgi:hypothetical protein